MYMHVHAPLCMHNSVTFTCTGVAAISIPATPPPRTRPSGPAKDTLKPLLLKRLPSVSEGRKEPVIQMISNRP